ncbi:MAG: alkaline phosphatase family protein [Burkholderiales bacterium]|nr:alkaline phosphatase family protein [Burkholderiales bacterium]ODU72320.1 MAG: hypothetical protein ABT05_00455 [Lautropia sp. SCN 66-9]
MNFQAPPDPPHAIAAAASIVNLAAALALRCGAPAGAAALADPRIRDAIAAARSIVLVVLDGFGERQLHDHAAGGALADCRLATLSSVFPSSTAPAMTSFASALLPAVHGNPGWFVWSQAQQCIVRSLPLDVRGDPAMPVEAGSLWSWPAWPTASKLPCFAWLPAEIAESRYSRFAYDGATRIGYRRLDDIGGALAEVLQASPAGAFAQIYLPQFDAVSHEFGCRSPQAARVASDFDRWFERLAHRLREFDVLLLATADHGFIDVEPDDQYQLADYPALAACLSRPLTGEPRVPFCQVRAGREDEFTESVAQAFDGAFDVYASEALLAAGWFGLPPAELDPGAHREAGAALTRQGLHERLGTHLLVPRAPVVLLDQVDGERAPAFIGMHGGISDDEMRVPLMAAYRGHALG